MAEREPRKIRKFTPASLDATAEDWKRIAGDDEFQAELSTLFDWCSTHLEHQDGDAFALDLYNAETNHTEAILEIVRAKHGELTKLLKLYPSPELWTADSDPAVRQALREVYADAFFNVIVDGIGIMDPGVVRGGKQEVREVKIYGRSGVMYELLLGISQIWPSKSTGWSATMQGRWLSLSKEK